MLPPYKNQSRFQVLLEFKSYFPTNLVKSLCFDLSLRRNPRNQKMSINIGQQFQDTLKSGPENYCTIKLPPEASL